MVIISGAKIQLTPKVDRKRNRNFTFCVDRLGMVCEGIFLNFFHLRRRAGLLSGEDEGYQMPLNLHGCAGSCIIAFAHSSHKIIVDRAVGVYKHFACDRRNRHSTIPIIPSQNIERRHTFASAPECCADHAKRVSVCAHVVRTAARLAFECLCVSL